jgi:hypothetical protein
LANALSARIRAIVRRNEALAEAQDRGERTDESPEPLPSQADLDSLVADYDYAGVRASGGTSASLSPLDKAMWSLARTAIRAILRQTGYSKEGKKAPVTVAKKGDAPLDNEVSFDTYESEVEALVNGEGQWGEVEEYKNYRQQLLESAQQKVDADERAAAATIQTLGLNKAA